MRPATRFICFGILALGLLVIGCAPMAPREKPVQPEVVAPPPEPVKPPPLPASTLDPREERRIVNQLLQDVEEYHRLLQEKNAERAAAYVDLERRPAYQDELWEFVARYKIESADVMSYELFPQPGVITAKVKVLRTLFRKRSVKPERSEHWMTWEYRQGRWVLLPQLQK
jgi:hypothetical protein